MQDERQFRAMGTANSIGVNDELAFFVFTNLAAKRSSESSSERSQVRFASVLKNIVTGTQSSSLLHRRDVVERARRHSDFSRLTDSRGRTGTP